MFQVFNEKKKDTTDKPPREILVRLIQKEKESIPKINFEEMEEEYKAEGDINKLLKIFGAGGVGASIGFVICIMTNLAGVPLTGPETTVLVGSLIILGIVTGYIVF